MCPNNKSIQRSWCLYDWANSGFATVILATVLPVYFAGLVPNGGGQLPLLPDHHYSATSIWGYAVAISMFFIALLAPTLGYLADRNGSHKKLLIRFCLIGCAATALLFFATDHRYWLATGLFILANFSFAGANIFYNSYLPHLTEDKELDQLSSKGYAYGYLGGGVLLALVFLLISYSPDRVLATRIGFVLTAVWWCGWSLPAFVKLPVTARNPQSDKYTLRSYAQQFRAITSRRDLFLFLLAFLCYNDGIQTLISVSAIYAKEELQLSQTSIIGCFLMIQFLAMPGALLCARISKMIGAKATILLCLMIFLIVSFFAYQMNSNAEFWALGAIIAFVLGGSQALSRALYASLIPPQQAAEFFGFFTISAKFAAIFGPLLFALITDFTGSPRQGILALGSFFIFGGILLCCVNVKRGQSTIID